MLKQAKKPISKDLSKNLVPGEIEIHTPPPLSQQVTEKSRGSVIKSQFSSWGLVRIATI